MNILILGAELGLMGLSGLDMWDSLLERVDLAPSNGGLFS